MRLEEIKAGHDMLDLTIQSGILDLFLTSGPQRQHVSHSFRWLNNTPLFPKSDNSPSGFTAFIAVHRGAALAFLFFTYMKHSHRPTFSLDLSFERRDVVHKKCDFLELY